METTEGVTEAATDLASIPVLAPELKLTNVRVLEHLPSTARYMA